MMDRLAARRRTSAAAMSTQLVLFISVTTIADTVLASSSPANRYRAALLWPGRKGTEACYGTEFLDDDPDLVEQQCKTEAFYHTKMCKSQVGMNIGAWPLRSKTAVWKMKVGEEDTGKNVLVSERDARHQKSSLLQPYSIDVLVEEEEEIRRREWREMRKALLLKHGADTGKNLLETKQFGDLEADLKSKVERLDSAEVQKAFESIAEDEVTRLAAKERELFATRGQIYESGSDQGRQALDSELEKQRNALLDGDATGTGGEAEKNQSQAELQKDKDAEDERLSGRLLPERALLRPFRGASTGEFSVSSPKLHYDLIKHFRFSRTGNETVLELGCAGGVTTRILVRLFKKVICVEKRPHFTRKLIPDYPNLVKVNFDLYQEHWAYHMAAVPVHVVFIDALHDYGAVLFDIKAVLAKIHCCVHTIAFHDFSFPGVMRAIEDSGVVKYYGKRWKHLGWGFPNNWRPNMRIQRTKGSMSKGLEQEDEDEHFTDAMSKAFTKQCPAVSSPAEVGGTETTSARSTSTTKKVIKRPSARGLNLPDKELSVAYAHQIKHNSSSSSSAITPPGTASSSSARIPSGAEVEMPWVSMAQNQQQWASLTAYFPTHPEGLLVELKDKFVAKSVLPPGLAPQIHDIPLDETQASKESDTSVENTVLDSSRSSTMNQIEAVERIFRSRYVCELDDDPNWVHTGEGPKPCTPEARRLQRLLRGADPEPLLLRQEVLYYDRKTIRTLLLRRFLERVVAGLSRGTGTAEEDAEMKRPTPAPLSVLALGPEFEKRADEIDARTLEGMVSQIERRQSESNLELAPNKMLRKVRPFVRNQLRIDLLNHGVFAITDIAWQLNKARFLHQHLYPQLPKAMRSSLPHVFEGGEPSSLLRTFGFLQFLPNNEFKLVAGNEGLTWTHARLLRALFSGGAVTPHSVAAASDLLAKVQDTAFLDETALDYKSQLELDTWRRKANIKAEASARQPPEEHPGFPNNPPTARNFEPDAPVNNPNLYADRTAPKPTASEKSHPDEDPHEPADGMRLLTKAQAARSRLLKVVAGTYRLSEFDANTVYLLFKVSKPAYRTGEDTVTDHDAPANVFVGNGTAWVLQFSSSRSRFQVIDIFSMGDEWTVGPERDPTNGQGSVNYLGFTYQQMFRLVTQGNDEFADEGQVLQHVVQGMMQEPPK